MLDEKIEQLELQRENIKQRRENNRKHPYKIKIERNKNVKYLILIIY